MPQAMPRALVYLGAIALLAALPFFLASYQADVYRKMLLWVTLALGYSFLFGISGQVAFSHFAFYGIGAYGVVILWYKLGIPLPLAIGGAIALCAALSCIVAIAGTRLEGFYLALATLAFAQLLIVVLTEGGDFTGAAAGIQRYQLPPVFGYRITGPYYTIVIVLLLVGTYAILSRLERSWFGRACRAVRDNSEAAAAMGVDVARIKVIAFTLTSTLAGAVGVVYAFVDNGVAPTSFDIDKVFTLLFMIIIGGSGRLAGAIVGAVLLYLAPFVLEPYIGHHHPLVYGFIMLGAILFQREGLIGVFDNVRRRLGRGRANTPRAEQSA
jgi:branched-chain amino acid transport system permease protein